MSGNSRIRRKDFLSQCGGAFLGLGLGVSCGKPAREEAAAPVSREKAHTDRDRTVTPAFRTLGGPKIEVTEIGFGASRTMDPGLTNYALVKGINFIDTGRAYYNGQNEFMVGKVIEGRRKELVINSKILPAGLEKMRKDLETSLKALGTDYIDCLMIHGASEEKHILSDEIKEFFSIAKEEGKVRTFGFSSHTNFIELLEIAARKPFHEVIMVPYNFLGRYTHMLTGGEKEWNFQGLEQAIRKCGENGIDFISMKGCSGGFKKEEDGTETYKAALKWVLNNPYMKTAAVAMSNYQQVDEDILAMGKSGLGAAEKDFLDRYAADYGSLYCRMCESCEGRCRQGVRVAEINRLHMYAESYGGEMAYRARNRYATMGRRSAAACTSCKECTVECAFGIQVREKMIKAHAALTRIIHKMS
ncbi:MAG: aldo/keto reductase [Gemmatimonadota bacterium]|nr:aldo/keto reductase [Gemmatimonadota bacterium]